MFVAYFYIFQLFIFSINGLCSYRFKYFSPRDIIAICDGKEFVVNTKIHRVEWGDFMNLFPNEYPYVFLTNGSLLIKQVSQSSSHFLCEVKDRATNKSLHKCGTSVTIIKPLMMKFTPVNQTVKRGSEYRIQCHGGGGDSSNLELKYFINDKNVKISKILINEETKIECRLTSSNMSLSVVAYIKVNEEGKLSDEEKFLESKCAPLTDGVCYRKFPEISYRMFSSYIPSRTKVETILMELFQVLDNKIIAEHNEEKCLDRFQRLVCATLYTPCYNKLNNGSVKRSICRESCDVTLEVLCRNTINRIKKQFYNFMKRFTQPRANLKEVQPEYIGNFEAKIKNQTLSVFNCGGLQPIRNGTTSTDCHLLNLDIIPGPDFVSEEHSSQCYNKVGRNFTGKVTMKTKNSECIKWESVPQLTIAFYQQSLQNESSFCRNPGGIFNLPMCPVAPKKLSGSFNFEDIVLVPCTEIYQCDFWNVLRKSGIEKGSIGTIIIVCVVFVVILSVAFIVYGVRRANKKSRHSKKSIPVDQIQLTNDHNIELYDNKVYMYKNVQNGHYSCPIYNSACLERVAKISEGAYGEILLVQAVFEDAAQAVVDGGSFSGESAGQSDDNSIDDFILSKDKTFNGKPCWPFDKSSTSGCCPFAVIKFSLRCGELLESRFAQETKILSQLNHPNIIRFYGVSVNNTGKIISRIVEYLPNGTLYSILMGERPKSLTPGDHDRSKVENGYQKLSAFQKQRLKENNNYIPTTEIKTYKRKKTVSSQSKELEPPRPADHIDLYQKQLVKWIIDICDAVLFLHTKHLIHRDIATRNCLVGQNLETKLADFNFVQKFTIGHDLIGNTQEFIPIRWLPRETLDDLKFNIDTDVWMFGVFMWEVMSRGKTPYGDCDLNEAYGAIVSGELLPIPDKCDVRIYGQMQLCWVEPNLRPCLETIKQNMKKILELL